MHISEHERRCEKILGNKCTQVHIYIDQYFPLFRSSLHWCILHHKKGVDLIVKEIGHIYGEDLTRKAASLHIIDDMGYIADDWTGLEDSCFMINDDEAWLKKTLNEVYGASNGQTR